LRTLICAQCFTGPLQPEIITAGVGFSGLKGVRDRASFQNLSLNSLSVHANDGRVSYASVENIVHPYIGEFAVLRGLYLI